MWKNKYYKAVTFSYDDGITQDIRLVQLLNKYGLKATFNINTGLASKAYDFNIEGTVVSHLTLDEMLKLYEGHEVAVHTVTHPFLTNLSDEDVYQEIKNDSMTIEKIFGVSPVGMAYPYGVLDDRILSITKQTGLRYARTVISNHKTHIQTDLLRFEPTAHHSDTEIMSLIDRFINYSGSEPQILYIWGHSYECDVDQNWDHIETIFKKLSNLKDVFYGTNREVLLDK